MRIFLGAFGQPGHAFPMLALGAELAGRGHAVTFETWTRWRGPAQAAGTTFLPAPEYPVFPTDEQPFDEMTKADEITVRYVPTPDDIVDEMSKLAKIGKDDVVYDLGCGNCVMRFGQSRNCSQAQRGAQYDPQIIKKYSIPNVKKHKLEDKIEVRARGTCSSCNRRIWKMRRW